MTVYTTKTIVVTITGTNGDFTAAFDSYNIGNDGEHLKTILDIVLPTAWNVFIATTPASFISVEYKNAKGRCGRSADIAVPALITTHISYEIPRDALYSGETEFWFTITQPIDATESRITKTAVVRCNVGLGHKAGTVPDPFGHDIIQQLVDVDAANYAALDLAKLDKNFTASTNEVTLLATDIIPINKAAGTLKKSTLQVLSTWLGETITHAFTTTAQTIKGAINELKADLTNLSFTGSTHDALVTAALSDIEGVDFGSTGLATYLDGRLNKWETIIKDIVTADVKSFGAKVDGSTDDTTAIKNAIIYLASIATDINKPTLLFPSGLGCVTTENIIIPENINVQMNSPLIYQGALNEPCLTITDSIKTHLQLNVLKKVYSNWTNEDCIGVKLINAKACQIIIEASIGFTIGVQLIGSAGGFAYNTITLNHLLDNKIALDLTNETSGYCNENYFIGGRFTCDTGFLPTLERIGVRITSKDGSYLTNNNNYFVKPSFELNTNSGVSSAIAIDIVHGVYNEFVSCRNEGNSTVFARVQNASNANIINLGYVPAPVDISNILDTSVTKNTLLTSRKSPDYTIGTVIFNSGALHKKACYYDGNTTVNIPGVIMLNSSGVESLSIAPCVINDNYLDLSRTVGIYVNTSIKKRFILRKDAEIEFGGRVGIKCYDASGVLLTSADANHPYVNIGTYSVSLGGSYITGADSDNDMMFTLHPDVKKIMVCLTTGTAHLKLRSFSIEVLDSGVNGMCSCWVGIPEISPGVNIMTTPPTDGTWTVGRRGINSVPTVGQPKSWICTTAGTPGTWVSEGNL